MAVLLCTSADCPAPGCFRHWLAVTGTSAAGLDPALCLPGIARRLEQAFMDCRETWWELGRALASGPGAGLSHAVACGAFGSDFGLMLAWGRIAAELATEGQDVLIVCDDPWLFRHLAGLPGIQAGRAPALLAQEWRLKVRGFAARGLLALRLIRAWAATRAGSRGVIAAGSPVLLVYGHPGSRADGFDVYFGTLMQQGGGLKRLLHTDCPPERAKELGADGRSVSLHAWGCPGFALLLPFMSWRPRAADLAGPYGWLVRRAARLENGGGGPAMNRWQMACQRKFLRSVRPLSVCWPWENHAWERDLCRAARPLGVRTIGYQHTVIGPHQINYSPQANVDGLDSLPDRVLADGPAYRDELRDWGVPASRLAVAGAWRFQALSGKCYAPDAPVFVPLSAIPAIARLQVEAARAIAATGRRVLVKEHPMYPLSFAEGDGLARTEVPITGHQRLSAVLYATGTSGLEALLLGLPAFRLLPADRLAIDVLPRGVSAASVTLDEVVDALAGAVPPPPLAFETVLAAIDIAVWKSALLGAIDAKDSEEPVCPATP